MGNEGLPKKVRDAKVQENIEALSIMGTHGSRKAAEARKMKKAAEERDKRIDETRAADEEWHRITSANEHIIPPPSAYGD